MTDDRNDALIEQGGSNPATGALADQVISVLRERQSTTAEGVRRFVLDHLVRAICSSGPFDPKEFLDILRGHRIPLDRVIEAYIPQAAERLGEMWIDDEVSFATVTVGAMRLQSVLSEASGQMFFQPSAAHVFRAVVVVPKGEQHFLGASVLAAQLRRMGCETVTSFAEDDDALRRRAMFDRPDAFLFTCSRASALEQIRQSVLKLRGTMSDAPVMAVGGALRVDPDIVKESTGADIVTTEIRDVIAFCAQRRKALTGE